MYARVNHAGMNGLLIQQLCVGPRPFGADVDSQLPGLDGLPVAHDAVEGLYSYPSFRAVGLLTFIPQSKSTTEKEPKLGLFSYPVLQAADILVHRATHVPVGEDQAQHLEFARECAGSFNHAIGRTVLVPPDTILSPARRVMSLTNPTKKMSKSDANPKSRILITDDRDAIAAKLRTAVTDSIEGVSYEPETRPGVSNLVEIMFHMGAGEPASGAPQNCDELAKECEGLSMRALKERVTDVVDAGLAPVRERYYELMQDESALDEIKEEGAKKARESAERTMRMVRDAIGF